MSQQIPTPPLPREDLEHVLRHTEALWDDLRGQSVFMTGGTGFVGTWLLESLLCASETFDLGVDVVVLTRDAERYCARSPHLATHPAVRVLRGDVTSFEFPEGRYPFVIHAATPRAFPPDAAHPVGTFEADVAGTRRVLEFARGHGVRKFLFTSSGAVYGRQPAEMTHIPEEYSGAPATTDAASAYGQAKRVSEFMAAMYSRACGFDAAIARLFAFVGPLLPLDVNFAVGNFIRDALGGGPLRITGDGTPYRSYLYSADLAIWLCTILLRGKSAYPYNVGSPDAVTILDLARTVVRVVAPGTVVDVATKPVPGSPRLSYVPRTTRAEVDLGLDAWIPLDEGIRRHCAWHRRNGAGTPGAERSPTASQAS